MRSRDWKGCLLGAVLLLGLGGLAGCGGDSRTNITIDPVPPPGPVVAGVVQAPEGVLAAVSPSWLQRLAHAVVAPARALFTSFQPVGPGVGVDLVLVRCTDRAQSILGRAVTGPVGQYRIQLPNGSSLDAPRLVVNAGPLRAFVLSATGNVDVDPVTEAAVRLVLSAAGPRLCEYTRQDLLEIDRALRRMQGVIDATNGNDAANAIVELGLNDTDVRNALGRPLSTPTTTRTNTQAPAATATPSFTSVPVFTSTPTVLVPSATPSATVQPTGAPVCNGPRPTPVGPAVFAEDLRLPSPGPATLTVRLASGGLPVAGTQNDLGFGNGVTVKARANGRPDCAVNPDIDKTATSFAFRPTGCGNGTPCTAVRALVLSTDNIDEIPDGSVLYTCAVEVSDSGAVLPVFNVTLSRPEGVAIEGATGRESLICLGSGAATPTPTLTVPPTPTQPSGQVCAVPRPSPSPISVFAEDQVIPGPLAEPVVVSVPVRLVSNGVAVAGTQNDLVFAGDAEVLARANGRPDCSVNPEIEKSSTSFAFQPPGCASGTCTGLRALVFSTDNTDAIPSGSILYTCRVRVSAAGGELRVGGVILSSPAGDRIDDAMSREGFLCVSGAILPPTPAPTATPTPAVPTPDATSTPTAGMGTPTATATASPTPLPAVPEFGLGDATGAPGGRVLVSVELDRAGRDLVTVSPLDFRFDPEILTPRDVPCSPAAGLATAFEATSSVIAPGVLRVVLTSLPLLPLPDGDILDCAFDVNPAASLGASPLTFLEGGVADRGLQDYEATGRNGTVTIVDQPSLVLGNAIGVAGTTVTVEIDLVPAGRQVATIAPLELSFDPEFLTFPDEACSPAPGVPEGKNAYSLAPAETPGVLRIVLASPEDLSLLSAGPVLRCEANVKPGVEGRTKVSFVAANLSSSTFQEFDAVGNAAILTVSAGAE